jgi:hypothetical protein
VKLTRQGVRDLGSRNVNGHRARPHRHFYGPVEVVGRSIEYDPEYGMEVIVPVYGRSCIHCGDVRQES